MVFATGCSNLKNSWGNFRAYYNTYYNAEKNFNTGLQKVRNQSLEIDPSQPVRVHRPPVQAGNSDFQEAIDKGAKILRTFPTSKWADDALLLIGKSYYYRQEFFPALQKFEELRNATSLPNMQQLAIIWKGRTQFDLKQYSRGAAFLESELSQYPVEWSDARKAEIQVLAAEHHAMQQQWQTASDLLSTAVPQIESRKLLGRTLFLYGQVLERLERYGEAYYAFSKVPENFPGFEYSYWARYKQADVARKEGNLQMAIDIYERLRKDDKNFERRGELSFEIARTREMQGDLAQAEQQYKELLHSNENKQVQDLRADIYYQLGKLYSEKYNNFSLAAAYFDSSSAIGDSPEKVSVSQDPQSLADAFGRFTTLQNTAERADSLLRLGRLSPAELDTALERIRAQKRADNLQERQSEADNTIANEQVVQSGQQETAKSQYGFLNHRNPELATRSREEFRIVWGNRPLIDDWRRMEVVRQSSVSRTVSGENQQATDAGQGTAPAIDMNLDDIPQTPEERGALASEKVNAEYELGNLLFLNLNSPDKARRYFYRVINSPAADELRPRAMYSLYELFNTQDIEDSVAVWKERILQEYPGTRYAQRVTGKGSVNSAVDSSRKIAQAYQQIMASADTNKALQLRQLALNNKSEEIASEIFYESIKAYIRKAKEQDYSQDSLAAMIQPTVSEVLGKTDSAAVTLPSRLQSQRYQGALWDSTRAAIQQFNSTFSAPQQQERVSILANMLEQPDKNATMPTCEELGISLSVAPSMQAFLSTVRYSEELQDTSLSGKVVYAFIVDGRGDFSSYELVSQRTSLGIEDSFEQAFEESFRFEPLNINDAPSKIRCEVAFPIDN